MDSIGGLVAGSMDTLRVAGEAMNLQRGAATGVAALNSIHALKFGAQVAGVFGGFLNGYVSYLKAEDAKENGLRSSFVLHRISMVSFGGTALAAGAPVAAGGLSYLAARNIGGRFVQGAATRMTAATVAGAWIPVAGWVLLGVGITASVGAALLEPRGHADKGGHHRGAGELVCGRRFHGSMPFCVEPPGFILLRLG